MKIKKTIWQDILVLIPFLGILYFYETHLLMFYFGETHSTYYQHVQFAQLMAETGKVSIPHFLYQILVIATSNLFYTNNGVPVFENLLKGGYLVSVSVTFVLFGLLYFLFRRAINREGVWYSIQSALMGMFFMMGSAINVLFILDKHTYFGYLPLNVYNSPTYTLLKLSSLPLFLLACKTFAPSNNKNWWLIPGSALFTILSALSKPSFIVIILPAVGLMMVYKLLAKEYINWRLFLIGMVLPSVIVLGWQYYISYATAWQNLDRLQFPPTRIAFMPFGQFIRWNVPLPLLFPKLLLSILFPLIVYFAYWETARKDLTFNLGWLIFIFGCISTYSFVEITLSGKQAGLVSGAGNFTWSGLIGVYILFVAAALFFLRQNFGYLVFANDNRHPRLRLTISLIALALHLVFGLIWYFNQFHIFSARIY
jgi:hypothetical protein